MTRCINVFLEDKVKAYKDIGKQIEELEKQKKALVAAILELIPKETKSVHTTEYCVRRMSRLSFKISLENARLLDAVKTAEVVDKEKIKKLVSSGYPVPDVKEIEFIQVSSLGKSE